jgi:type III restriction enzyme
MIPLKPFQQQAVDSAVAVFDYMRGVLDQTGADENARATAIHDNGYLLIEAPTGSGKTLMAGHIVERVSLNEKVVWFWFAPFKGVVDQSAAFLREQFTGLRLRTMTDDRNPIGTRSGDVFVTTWQLVATRVKDRRSVRQNGEQNSSIDDLIVELREQGYRIGVVVDEAHHGFHGDTQAAVFFRQVLKPEFTVLVTATPDDADLRDLKERMQISTIHRVGVSRSDAVGPGPEAGLIKSGVKAMAWRAEEGSDVLVDFEQTALRDGADLHRMLNGSLKQSDINLTPLMLVQVDSSRGSVERAKAKLLGLGFAETQIATHTADEPDAGLLAIANDEGREVLIFKMAVALGFDCPRAWTLVSMRSTRDEDFGVQLVGRILRTHRRLQGRIVPDALKFGYVLLADIDSQGGLDAAGQRINRIKTQLATV